MSTKPDPARLRLKVVPGATNDAVVGWLDSQLKMRVAAAPEKGRANKAVTALLADFLDLPAASIAITGGHGSARKRIEITGLDQNEAVQRINARLDDDR